MAAPHKHKDQNSPTGEWMCTRDTCREALRLAYQQQEKLGMEYYSLAEYVESLEVGTIFEDTDDIGRKHTMMRVWGGVIINNGGHERPFEYGDSWEDGYSVRVTHVPTPTQEGKTQ